MEENKKFNPLIIVGILAAIGIFGLVIMMTKGTSTSESSMESNDMTLEATSTPGYSAEVMTDEDEEMGETKTFNVEAGSFYFKPNQIKVNKGDKVKIVISAVDMMHDFVIDELGVKAPVTPNGTSSTIEFVASEVGEFEYYCSVGNHKQMGQVGTLIVEE